ncbi:MAG TPA: hypothetical protein VHL79_12425 [Ramlibacter sp.]|jgi:hypothetical protein|nr:hypothetical protein [Ramlibacter sp.]
MGMFDKLLGKKAEGPARPRAGAGPNSTQFDASQQMSSGAGQAQALRKDLLRLVLREMLTRNGIPQEWLAADMLRTSSPAAKEHGLHVRFLVKRWEPRLMLHGPALEQEFAQRLTVLDPAAEKWLMGFSWQFAMEQRGACPPLPHPGSWTAPAESEAAPLSPATRPGDIIEGPAMTPRPLDEVRADLESLLALRDQDMKRHAGDAYAATRPASL